MIHRAQPSGLALIPARPWAGNAIAPTYGYACTAPRALLLFGLTVGFPLISADLAIHIFAHMRLQLLVHVIDVVSALLAWIVGGFVAVRILYTV